MRDIHYSFFRIKSFKFSVSIAFFYLPSLGWRIGSIEPSMSAKKATSISVSFDFDSFQKQIYESLIESNLELVSVIVETPGVPNFRISILY